MQYPATNETVYASKFGKIKLTKIVFKDGRTETVEKIDGYAYSEWMSNESKMKVHPVICGCIFKSYDLADIAYFEGE